MIPGPLDMPTWVEQNEDAARGLSPELLDKLAPYAGHHAGGLWILGGWTRENLYVKMHDTWGDDGPVIVHTYDPYAAPEDVDADVVECFTTGTEAATRFLSLVDPDQ